MGTVDRDVMGPLPSSGDYRLMRTSGSRSRRPFVIWRGMGLVTERSEHVPHSQSPSVLVGESTSEGGDFRCQRVYLSLAAR